MKNLIGLFLLTSSVITMAHGHPPVLQRCANHYPADEHDYLEKVEFFPEIDQAHEHDVFNVDGWATCLYKKGEPLEFHIEPVRVHNHEAGADHWHGLRGAHGDLLGLECIVPVNIHNDHRGNYCYFYS